MANPGGAPGSACVNHRPARVFERIAASLLYTGTEVPADPPYAAEGI